ncbi:MAG: aldehyde dehydrogenase family protein [Sphingomonadales bacterium]|nr:MAG: aldehyde dehydrogenase family protein [Sphingomonadales bacterium]
MENIAAFTLTIDGKAVETARTLTVENPATGTRIASVPAAGPAELDAAIASARAAWKDWSAQSLGARRACIEALAAAIAAEAGELARLLTAEQGKPLADAMMEIQGGAYLLGANASLDIPRVILSDTPERRVEAVRVPLGVVGAIVPWNFPFALAIMKIGPAMLAGNCVILKPSPFTPLTSLRLGEIARRILPPGVLNVISGDDALGPLMTEHEGIDKITFTGSTATGKRVMAGAAKSLKRVTLELGGNDAAIVLPDFDIASQVEPLFWAAFQNAGQVCMASKRIYIHASIYDQVRDALVAYARTVRVGNGAEEGIRIGPINNRPQYERVVDLIADCKAQGHSFAIGGDTDTSPGLFVPVTIIDNPPDASRIVAEEQFGPVVPLLKYDSTKDVIARANASPYGLGASVWGRDAEEAQAVAEQIDTGVAWINEAQFLPPEASFGGRKQSGIGVEGGAAGLIEFTSLKTIVLKKL